MPSYFYVQRYVENGFLIYLLVEIRLRVFSLVLLLVLTGVCQGGGVNNNLVDSLPFKQFPANRGGGGVGGCHRCVEISKFFGKNHYSRNYYVLATHLFLRVLLNDHYLERMF